MYIKQELRYNNTIIVEFLMNFLEIGLESSIMFYYLYQPDLSFFQSCQIFFFMLTIDLSSILSHL